MSCDKLYFFSGSVNRSPGEGPNERVANPKTYTGLSQIHNWRKMLSNFYVAPFEIDRKTYRTVEHYFQSQKFIRIDPILAETFTLESATDLGTKGDGLAARSMRKSIVLTKDQLREWDIIKDECMARAWYAKFTQNAHLEAMLLETNNAELWHAGPRVVPCRFLGLETLRSEMRQSM